jgi:hypothetical protein
MFQVGSSGGATEHADVVVSVIALMIFWRAAYAWGFFGAFIVLGGVLLLFAWIYDRRNARTQV